MPQTSPRVRVDMVRQGSLAREVYQAVFNATESFEVDNIGADLSYLLGAILNGTEWCEWGPDRPIIRILQKAFTAYHPVWATLKIQQADAEQG